MINNSNLEDDEISKFFKDPERVTAALQAGIQTALLRHKKMGNPICVSRNGKIIWIPPEDILVEIKK